MVKIAVAGGTGELAREVIDALVAANKHEITILSRNTAPGNGSHPGISFRAVDYTDKDSLISALKGIHTVLSFINQPMAADDKNNSQKNLIDASIAAGVKRFAPSEYGSHGKEDLPFWSGKNITQKYLEHVNENQKVLEYTLFQPGLYLDYLASPHRTAKYVTPLETFIDFQHRRAIVVEGHEDAYMTLTAVSDIAGVVAQAVDLEDGKWPAIGGIRGNRVTISQIIGIGEKTRGPFTVDKVRLEDLRAGKLTASWTLGKKHPAFSDEEAAAMFKGVLVGMLLSSAKGAWDVSDAFNGLLPGYKFKEIESFLAGVWEGKP
ncbi:hypothetical protein B0H66DRAFT_520195 [Apodospora peruviana]|uniref:NmrA-like domain-containing protein n=1 Tax=Apodospora peruviana TaxID=516989 RepID=A0AAE0I2E9_9PEZI|nr:hypothetical protein B0H66DRAFT_520195 [Apodospora peruviana]